MDLVKIKELAFKHLANRKAHKDREKGFIYYHGQRVANIAVELRKKILPDEKRYDGPIVAAAYFHDIAKGIEPHSYYGTILVQEILQDYCTGEELELICEIIRYHQFRDKTKNYNHYIKLVQDADVLDHGGLVEIWMNFLYNAHRERTLLDSLNFYQTEYDALAQKMRGALNYPISLEIYDEKQDFIKGFVERMNKEAYGKLI